MICLSLCLIDNLIYVRDVSPNKQIEKSKTKSKNKQNSAEHNMLKKLGNKQSKHTHKKKKNTLPAETN